MHGAIFAEMFERTVIDLARLIVGYCSHAYTDPEERRKFLAGLIEAAEWNQRWAIPVPKSRETNGLLMLRGIANAFQDDTTIGDALWAKDVSYSSSVSSSSQRSDHADLTFRLLPFPSFRASFPISFPHLFPGLDPRKTGRGALLSLDKVPARGGRHHPFQVSHHSCYQPFVHG